MSLLIMDLGMILCNFGFHAIDENLQALIHEMAKFPEGSILSTIQGWAKIIGFCLALGVGSYECWMMILGRRGMDVMKILRIIIISMCIAASTWIANAAQIPGKELGDLAYNLTMAENTKIQELETEVQNKQRHYRLLIDTVMQQALLKAKEGSLKDRTYIDIGIADIDITEFKINAENTLKQTALTLETKMTEFVSIIIRSIGEFIFQIAYYGMILASYIFMHIMMAFCPIAFALSLAPPYRSAWSQWLSKFISLSLWAFIIYVVIYYASFIMRYNLELDVQAYDILIKDVHKIGSDATKWSNIADVGMQGLGTTCMYVVGLLIGVFILKFVPDVASWLIPGGVGSPMGGAAVGMATGAVSKGVNVVSQTASPITGAGSRLAGTIGNTASKNLTINK